MSKAAADKGTGTDVAFVGWQTLPAAIPQTGRRIGGLETAMWTLARGMAASGKHRVALLSTSDRGIQQESIAGVELWVIKDPWRRMRQEVGDALDLQRKRLKVWDHRLIWRIPLLAATYPWRTRDVPPTSPDPRMLRFTPRAWCVFGVSDDAARAVAAARHQGIPIALFLQSNADIGADLLDPNAPPHPYGDSREGRLYALNNADQIVCQSVWQFDTLRERFHREGVLIRNPIDVHRWQVDKPTPPEYVLWIGRFDSFHKRPELLFQIARQCPHVPFLMICNSFDREVENELRGKIPVNVTIQPYVPFEQMPSVFSRAAAFVSTGNPTYEGFPNVLLQAAASHTPIASLEDYDQFIVRSKAGKVCSTIEQMAELLTTTWKCAAATAAGTTPGRQNEPFVADWSETDRYLNAFHSLTTIVEQADQLLEGLIAGHSR